MNAISNILTDLQHILFGDKKCPICCESYETMEPYVTRCGHVFHEHCILKHGLQNPCPIC